MNNEKESVIIGLDISSSVIGISVFNLSMKLIELKFLKFKSEKIENYEILFNKVELFENLLKDYLEKNNFILNEVRIEANAKAFSGGKTTAHTMFILAKINALVAYTVWKNYPKIKIKETQVASARKKIGFKKKKDSKDKIKEQVFNHVISSYAEVLKWLPVKTFKSGPRKGEIGYEDHARDMIDAYVIAKGS